uniref:SXP/RAL-2 family protein Ani s 5-like cation-binding domain-containing protein n=2 Tax=Homalodisca liturata TaxID=320908 RepID=A0A1B6HBE1_9HEMI
MWQTKSVALLIMAACLIVEAFPTENKANTKKSQILGFNTKTKDMKTAARSIGLNMTPQQKNARVSELEADLACVIGNDIVIASKSYMHMAATFSKKETTDFFNSVAMNTMENISYRIETIKNLIENNSQAKAKKIAENIANEAAAKGFRILQEKKGKLDWRVMESGVVGISKNIKELITQALTEQ